MIETQGTQDTFLGNGFTTVFPGNAFGKTEDQFDVYLGTATSLGALLTIDTDYSLSNLGNTNGSGVVFTLVVPPPVGSVLRTYRNTDNLQLLNVRQSRAYDPQGIENQLDRMVMAAQERDVALTKAVRVMEPVEPFFPVANTVIIFDEDGQPGPGPTADEITNAQSYADDAANSAALALAAAANSADGFPTLDAFARRIEVGDIYPIGAVVPVAGSFFQKVNLPNAAKGWGDTGERANWLETLLPKSEGAVKRRFMEKMSRKTFLGNPNAFDATPIQMGRTLALATLGFDGGGNGTTGYYHLPELPSTPPAPSLLQKSIVTSSSGGAQVVTFETPFQTTVPTVILTAVASGSEIAVAQLTAAPTTTGFSFEVRNASGTRIARDVHYFAFGNGA